MKSDQRNEQEWQSILTPEQYWVCRQKGTERPFANQYYDCKDPGVYHCVACGAALFDSTHKYDSGSGWPSFYQPSTPKVVAEHLDTSHDMARTEVVCAHCESHLGHLFPDGPAPTGMRYCINSAALQLRGKNTVAASNTVDAEEAHRLDG